MARTAQANGSTTTLYMALELSKAKWKLGFATNTTQKPRIVDVTGGDIDRLLEEVARAKERFGLPADAPVKSCYEAGRDGFWIHRCLASHGIHNVVVDSSSIGVSRRARQTKTDRVDVVKLVRLVIRHDRGEDELSVVRVPPPEAEDERGLPRHRKTLKEQQTRLTNAIRAVLTRHGLDLDPRRKSFRHDLDEARMWDGAPLPPWSRREIDLQLELLEVVERQIKALEQEQAERLEAARKGAPDATDAAEKAALLCSLKGVGETGAYVLSTELFADWRGLRNRGEVGALVGLTGTPFSSGSLAHEQGISKAGNKRVRALVIQLAWGWLRWQPNSKQAKWYRERVGKNGGRAKRKAIVAMARKLLIELWHFVTHGTAPQGAEFKSEAPKAAVAAVA